jgi:predicted DNA-binding protein (MmcQ/YjbR family)
MDAAAFDAACRALPGVTMDILWGEDHVYKVGGRMFAALGPLGDLSMKVSDIAYAALIEMGAARPAPYLARAKWVRFESLGELDAAETLGWLSQAHALVAAKLTRAQRRELGIAERISRP